MVKGATDLGGRCTRHVTPTLGGRFGCASSVRVPMLGGVMVGRNLNVTATSGGVVSITVGRVSTVANRGTITAISGGSITGFGLHGGVPVNIVIALHHREVCRFLRGLIHITLPHVHSFGNVRDGFSNHKGCALNVRRRVVFPRVAVSSVSHVLNVGVAFMAATRASRRNCTLLGRFKLPFGGTGGSWSGVTGRSVGTHRIGETGVMTGCTRGHTTLGGVIGAKSPTRTFRTTRGLREVPGGTGPVHLRGHYGLAKHPGNCVHRFKVSHVRFHRVTSDNLVPNMEGSD